MKTTRRLISTMLSFCLILSLAWFPTYAQPSDAPPTVSARAAVLMEAESGKIIFSKSADFPLPMASTTKIMTALVALELCAPTETIEVSAEAVGVEGSSIYLTEGESLTLEQLLYALLLESANDAAVAIATGLCGSVEAFADKMNQKATDLGLEQTHFTNPHGLDDDAHFTTAYELACIARAALQDPLFSQIVSTRKTTIPNAVAESTRLLVNHNKMLRFYEGCIGVKTGFTKSSGRCLVSAATRDGVTLIAVTLDAPNDWNDHTQMLDHGFTQYQSVTLCKAEELTRPMSVTGGTDDYVMVTNKEGAFCTLPVTHGKITTVLELPRFAFAPVLEGECVGKAVFFCDTDGDGKTEKIGETPLVACYGVEQKAVRRSFWQWLRSLFGFDD